MTSGLARAPAGGPTVKTLPWLRTAILSLSFTVISPQAIVAAEAGESVLVSPTANVWLATVPVRLTDPSGTTP